MKKIFRIVLAIGILILCYYAFTSSKENGKSFWFNLGVETKNVVDDGVKISKELSKEVIEGYKTPNDSIK